MKEELEEILQEYLEAVTYQDSPIVESIVRGQADKPSGLSTLIIDFHQPSSKKAQIRNRGQSAHVEGKGKLVFIYKPDLEDAEERHDRIPDIVFDRFLYDPSLGGKIPGEVFPMVMESGFYELKNTDGLFFYMSYIEFGYNGNWIRPKILE
jgi:hypothetical protein